MDFIFGPFEASLFIWAHHIREAEHSITLSKLRKYLFQTPQVFLHSQEKKNGKKVFFLFSSNLCSYTDENPIARKQMCSLPTKIVDIFERTAGNDFILDIQYLISNIKYLILNIYQAATNPIGCARHCLKSSPTCTSFSFSESDGK